MNFQQKTLSLLIAAIVTAGPAYADDERASLEALRQTTLSLIEALVDSGVLPREKANALIRKAEQDAAKKLAQKAPASTSVRVQYVPEIVKSEIREQIKQEVLAQAKSERWAEPNAIPGWLDNIKWEGDVRLRYQTDSFGKDNATPFDYAFAAGTSYASTRTVNSQTRAADLAKVNSMGEPTANTGTQRERFRVRARLGMLAKISDTWSGGIRLATGNTNDRVSTNQTLGQDWNKYNLLVDQAFIKYDPAEWFSITGGKIPNPWFSTDLVWDIDLNFEGVAATFKPSFANNTVKPFLTVGYFPIKEQNPPASKGRSMVGVQGGTQWDLSSNTRFKVGLAWYAFRNFEGKVESDDSLDYSGGNLVPYTANYGQYEYGSGLRQKGNSLFVTNATSDTAATTYWGLASRFRPLNLTASLDLANFDPVHIVLTGDWVRNTAFDRGEIYSRTQGRVDLSDGSNTGYQYKLTVGMPQIKDARDWQAFVSYRRLGSDAVLDAFTDSDFGGGGTNLKGYILGLQYGLDRNAALGLRWFSADSIDSFAVNSTHRFAQDVFMADVNVRF